MLTGALPDCCYTLSIVPYAGIREKTKIRFLGLNMVSSDDFEVFGWAENCHEGLYFSTFLYVRTFISGDYHIGVMIVRFFRDVQPDLFGTGWG